MLHQETPYLSICSFCVDGLLRFRRCSCCDCIVAACDACELMWEDIQGLGFDTNLPSDSTFPQCPACGHTASRFGAVTMQELEDAGLQDSVEGKSSGGESVDEERKRP